MTDKLHLVYDGDCRFCTRAVRALKRVDVRDRLELHEAGDRSGIVLRFPALAGAELDEAMYAVQGERSWRGFFAFRRLIWESPWTWPLLPLFYTPGAARVGPSVYTWVARHRRSMGCRTDSSRLPR